MPEDFQDKTEEPTPKKLADARKKGIVAKSQDLTISIMLLGSMVFLFFFSAYMFFYLAYTAKLILTHLNTDIYDIATVVYWFRQGTYSLFWMVLPLFGAVLFMALICNILQVGFLFSTYPLIPRWKKLNLFNPSNYQNIFSWNALVRLSFGLVRINIVVILNFLVVGIDMFHIYNLSKGTAADILLFIHRKAIEVGGAIALGYFVVGIWDLMYQKWKYRKEMKMSRRELRDELKQMEGDTKVKTRIRSMMETLVQPQLQKILPYADVVIMGAKRYAVALSYQEGKMSAPLCLAKGFGKKAQAINQLASNNKVHIVENPSLAQSLFRVVQVDGFVPPEFYHQVAQAIIKKND